MKELDNAAPPLPRIFSQKMNRREFIKYVGLAGASLVVTSCLGTDQQQSAVEPKVTEKFPSNFLWGASTSGHQVGDNVNGGSDWNGFEIRNAQRLASEVGPEKDYGNGPLPSDVWQRIEPQARDPNNYISGRACGWWEGRWKGDLDIAHDLGMRVIRFSIERSRIQPTPDSTFDPEAMRHYKELIRGIKARGMEPLVTLNHFTIPKWLAERGGWENPESPRDFAEYVARLVRGLGEEVRYYIVINEPDVYLAKGYVFREWPPNKVSDLLTAIRVRGHLIDAHQRAYDVIKEIDPNSQVSSAINLAHTAPKTAEPVDLLGAYLFNIINNRLFLPWMVGSMDFIGVNHYFSYEKKGLDPRVGYLEHPANYPRSDLGWFLNPKSIYYVLKHNHYNRPVFITEHGLADEKDRLRPWFIKESLKYVLKAIQEGIDVQGYLHWALVDNFEWDKGFWPRFGLIGVDYETQQRTIRPSGIVYSRIIHDGCIK